MRLIALFLLIFLLLFAVPVTFAQEGASLFIEPQAGTFKVGSTFSVSVFINTSGKPVNAIEADLKFDHNKLQVVSLTTQTSLFKIWVEEPTYSNSQGTINLKGGVPSPGITTSKGKVVTITFRAKSTGSAPITFTDKSQLLANDGLGTDILVAKTGANVELVLPPPAEPVIASPTPQSDQTLNLSAKIRPADQLAQLESSPTDKDGSVYKDKLKRYANWLYVILGIIVALFAIKMFRKFFRRE